MFAVLCLPLEDVILVLCKEGVNVLFVEGLALKEVEADELGYLFISLEDELEESVCNGLNLREIVAHIVKGEDVADKTVVNQAEIVSLLAVESADGSASKKPGYVRKENLGSACKQQAAKSLIVI